MNRIKICLSILLPLQINFLFSQSKTVELNKIFSRLDENNQFCGVALVAEKNDILYHNAFGLANRQWKTPNTTDTKFNIQSISKTIIATAILKQVDNNILNLDSTVVAYIPNYKGANGDKITIRQLLNHTSGLPEDFSDVIPNKYYNSKHILQEIEETQPINQPGIKYLYSNLGYKLLSIILETVLKSDLQTILQETVFQPLKMDNSVRDNGRIIIEKMTSGYNYHLLDGYRKGGYENMSATFGNGGIVSTSLDLFLFARGITNNDFFRKNIRQEMFTNYLENYGLGCEFRYFNKTNANDSVKVIYHNGGGVSGFRSGLAWIEEGDYTIILLENSERSFQFGAYNTNEICDLVLNVLLNRDYDLPQQSAVTEIAPLIQKIGIEHAMNKYKQLYDNNEDNRFYFSKIELSTLGMQFRDDALNLRILEFGLEQYPDSYNFYHCYASVLSSVGKYNKAIEYFKKGLEVYKKYPEKNEQFLKWINEATEEIKDLEETLIEK
ncbi:MAG: serine hydrolase domain-containing protein [Bacteroidales bacterium]